MGPVRDGTPIKRSRVRLLLRPKSFVFPTGRGKEKEREGLDGDRGKSGRDWTRRVTSSPRRGRPAGGSSAGTLI